MKFLELASIVCFLLAGTANNDCIGGEYGKLVFDTKEEAVEAMEKMKNG